MSARAEEDVYAPSSIVDGLGRLQASPPRPRSKLSSSAFVEGWAPYSEELLKTFGSRERETGLEPATTYLGASPT
jgi:hypothetical protein